MDMLYDPKKWMPTTGIKNCLLSVRTLLANQNPGHRYSQAQADEFTKNRELFNQKARFE